MRRLLVLVLCGCPVPASAATVISHEPLVRGLSGDWQGGPALSGAGAVSWITGVAADGLRVRTASPGATPVTVGTLPALGQPPNGIAYEGVGVDGSPDGRIVVNQGAATDSRADGPKGAGRILIAGPAAGPLTRVRGCIEWETGCTPDPCVDYGGGAPVPEGTLEIAGAGFGECFARGGGADLILRGADGTVRYDLAGGRLEGAPATAGEYAATLLFVGFPNGGLCSQQSVQVRTVPTGAVLFTTPPVGAQRCLATHDVDTEGALATLSFTHIDGLEDLAWHTAADPAAHIVRAHIAYESPLAVSGSRAVVELAGREGRSALAVVGMSGHAHVVARFDRAWKRVGAIAYDGVHVAWAERRCGRPAIVRATVDAPRRAPPRRCK